MDLKQANSPCTDLIFFKTSDDKKRGQNQIKETSEVFAQTHNAKVHYDYKKRMEFLEAIPNRKLHTELVFKIKLVRNMFHHVHHGYVVLTICSAC